LVVGAGPGGAQAALTAAKRGHDVELWEKGNVIGGALVRLRAVRKKEMRRMLVYYKAQI
jgi:flavin-dependent dehydrogenase